MKWISLVVVGLVLMGCIDDEAPDETITVRSTHSDGTSSVDTFEYYYKDGEKVYGDISESGVLESEDETQDN